MCYNSKLTGVAGRSAVAGRKASAAITTGGSNKLRRTTPARMYSSCCCSSSSSVCNGANGQRVYGEAGEHEGHSDDNHHHHGDRDVMIFTVGLPGAGKTTVLHRSYGLNNMVIIDLDHEIKAHPRYDPKNPASVYTDLEAYKWANDRVEEKFCELLVHRQALVAVDGTGTKTRRQFDRMRRAKRAGYWIRLLHVKVSLQTAINRQQKRRRQVPKHILKAYEQKLERALDLEIPLADEYVSVDNNMNDGLTDLERWGSHVLEEIEEQSRVYDAIWTAIALRSKSKKRDGELTIPPWLVREVSGDFPDDEQRKPRQFY
eukprot:CAMPEP_0184484558 /NCGR_PEP_ID=MMETSP0113_2-20130426/6265_1 /TAXON_ID=91329 /ORGANISM="Norrisiella sphaerica, Strain BC52" /LENGTH=315 /DNA_ID=CAMNT_0026865593 /DNA_START=643 /DNA_END=1590 /DNA_ORIENTATION=+